MSRFVSIAIERLELDGGDWVDLRTRLTFGERRAIEQKLLGRLTGADDVAELRHAEANIETLRISISGWGGPGFCAAAEHTHAGECTPRPVTIENLQALDETGERILAEIVRRQVTRTDGFTTPRTSRTTPTEASSATTSSAPAKPDDASSSSRSSSSPDGPGTSS